ncbi:hypothetical protein [Mucilaginibacter polytrichastri]|uniref:Uncharacterized protein n=1 Tax=Mucilaginibacter polytrichastri TaxID=1302689 RepID=A0A1Q5ZXN8_9SPHI|nr:hypothetical protein [Mucilaginibacter polytrichastri]OKS86498.1 hypothetical protein RG47T_1954 [Mucilaginibacter polytrichastri]SFS79034.1 hypothetical protein SAMN04487890_10473 [Mucilaginibacter polytrichastri]
MENVKHLKFLYLKYEVKEITKLISKYQNINNFVFGYYAAEPYKGIQLLASVRLGDDCNDQSYAPETSILTPHGDQFLAPDRAVTLNNNFISIAAMKGLIESGKADYLLFTPNVNMTGHLYYAVSAIKSGLPGTGDDTLNTNPSPPATMAT